MKTIEIAAKELRMCDRIIRDSDGPISSENRHFYVENVWVREGEAVIVEGHYNPNGKHSEYLHDVKPDDRFTVERHEGIIARSALDADLPIRKGDTVIIPKGTPIDCTDGRGEREAKRDTKVTVHHTISGMREYIPHHASPGERVSEQPPKVCWVGAGGYWKQADINLVRKVSE